MDFRLTARQEEIVRQAREFATGRLMAEGCGEKAIAFDELWRCASADGYAGLPLPKAVGGREFQLLDCVLVFEAMAEAGADLGFLFSLGVHQFAVAETLSSAGSDSQKDAWLGPMASGTSCGAFAISERDSGSDAFSLTTVATKTDAGYELTGEKVWITNAPRADVFLVVARSEPVEGTFGLSCFILPKDTVGLEVEPGPEKAGLRTAPWGTLVLDKAMVSTDSLLGAPGSGAALFQQAMRWERCGLFALALGTMERSFRNCLRHVHARRQFGRALIENHVVAKSIALMKTRIEASRLLLYKAASVLDAGRIDDAAISLAKAYVSEAALENALEAQKLHGAAGILHDSPAAQLVNDMLPFRILSGPNDLHYQIAARLMQTLGT